MTLHKWLMSEENTLFPVEEGGLFTLTFRVCGVTDLFWIKDPKAIYPSYSFEYIGTYVFNTETLYCKKKYLKLLEEEQEGLTVEQLETLVDSLNADISQKIENKVAEYADLFLELDYRSDDFYELESRFREMELESLKQEMLISGQTQIQYNCAYTGRLNQNLVGFLERYFSDSEAAVEREVLHFFDDNQDEVVYQLKTQKMALEAAAAETELTPAIEMKRRINDALLAEKGKKVKLILHSGNKEYCFDVDKIKILGSKTCFPVTILTQKQAREFMDLFGVNFISLTAVDEIRNGKSVLYRKGEQHG